MLPSWQLFDEELLIIVTQQGVAHPSLELLEQHRCALVHETTVAHWFRLVHQRNQSSNLGASLSLSLSRVVAYELSALVKTATASPF